MKPFIRYIKSLWFPVIIVSILSLLTVAGTLYIPTLTATIINDGVDIRDVSRESLHNTVGMVLQDTWIFTGTITEQGTHHELIKRGGHYKERKLCGRNKYIKFRIAININVKGSISIIDIFRHFIYSNHRSRITGLTTCTFMYSSSSNSAFYYNI